MLKTIFNFECKPLVLVDIGARGGTKAPWSQLEKNLTIVGFEPESEEFERLTAQSNTCANSVKYIFYPNALWSSDSKQNLFITKGKGKSSLFKPNFGFLSRFTSPERFHVVKEVSLETKTLDQVLDKDFPNGVDFIKLDCQGADLDILKGSEKILEKSVFGIEIESNFGELYSDIPRFAEIDLFMRSKGFSLFDVKPIHWKRKDGLNTSYSKGQIVFVDALYFRDNDVGNKFETREALVKAMQMAALYGYFDFALEMALLNQALLSNDELDKIKLSAKAMDRSWLQYIPFRRRILHSLLWLIRNLSSHKDSTSNINGSLGNR